MAKRRIIETRFWSDSWISNLDPIEKLLFLYFLTNERTNLCGIYELPLKSMAVETGVEKEMIEKIMSRFKQDGKVYYFDGWVFIKNFQKHQELNPMVEEGIKRCLAEVPKEVREYFDSQSIDTPQSPTPNLTKPNLTKPISTKVDEGKPSAQDYKILSDLLEEIKKELGLDKWADENRWRRIYAQNALRDYGRADTLKGVKWMKQSWQIRPTKMATIYRGLAQWKERLKDEKPKIISDKK